MKKLGLYIHVPFCAGKCPYCDFYSVSSSGFGSASKGSKSGGKAHADYIEALVKQMREYSLSVKGMSLDTVYIGGGTPTVIGVELLLRVVKNIGANFAQKNAGPDSGVAEFTVEANPATVDLKGLKRLRKAGVNRLSLGLQSAHDKELRVLSRKYSYADFLECYRNAREAGFGNISVDVMYGVPTQTIGSFYETLKRVAAIEPEHISAYGLKIEPGTPFYKNFEKIREYMPGENEERGMYFMCCDFLGKAKYNQYEISNFARRGFECRHNLKYWTCEEYLGLGTGAHSYFAGCRFSFKKNIREYIQSFGDSGVLAEKLDIFDKSGYNLFDEYIEVKPTERIGEYVMLNFRLKAGINKNDFARLFLKNFDDLYYGRVEPFLRSGHILKTTGGYAFSLDGMLVSNYILGKIVEFD